MAAQTPENREEGVLEERSGSRRLFELDALRGLAAFTVICAHYRSAFLEGQAPVWQVPLFAAHQAVVLFFVLSGYVLSLPYWLGRQPRLAVYYVRRIFRIYVPFLAALLVAWLCARHFLFSQLALTAWFHDTWQTPLTWRLLLRQLLISQKPDINTAFWSLRYEMEASLLFPFLCWGMSRLRAASNGLAIAAMYLAGALCPQEELSRTLMFLSFFLLGAMLSRHASALRARFAALGRGSAVAALAVSLALYYHGNSVRHIHLKWAGQGLIAAGAGGVLLCAIYFVPFSRLLRTRVPEYLGRISYSLYLIHATVLFSLINLAYGKVGRFTLLLLFPLLAIAASHLFCIAVEEPAMRAGKHLGSAMQRRFAARNLLSAQRQVTIR